MKIIDLTLTIRDHWRWMAQLEQRRTYEEDHFCQQFIHFNPHGFTHVDAPMHFLPGGRPIEQVPLDKFMGEAAIVNLSHLNENDGVTAAELEKHGQHIREGDIVLLRTDWPLKCDYMSRDFWTKAPYTARDACEWLVRRKVKTVGYDYPCDQVLRYEVLDPQRKARREENTTHDVFFPAGIIVIEYVCNLHLINRERIQFMALPIPFEGADGSPARAIAFEE
jgi:arylformamidase